VRLLDSGGMVLNLKSLEDGRNWEKRNLNSRWAWALQLSNSTGVIPRNTELFCFAGAELWRR
jgi:hypothetical protein